MRKHYIRYNNTTWKRIDRKTAKKVYNNGLALEIIPCKLLPFITAATWKQVTISKDNCRNESFDDIIRSYLLQADYCNSYSGKYLAYYIPVKEIDRFNGSETAIDNPVETYDYNAYTKLQVC